MNKKEFGLTIRNARKDKGYTREELAEKVQISTEYLGEVERGLKLPSMGTFIKFVEALEVSADFILRNELSSGKEYVFDELTKKLENLTPKQRKIASDILDAYIQNL